MLNFKQHGEFFLKKIALEWRFHSNLLKFHGLFPLALWTLMTVRRPKIGFFHKFFYFSFYHRFTVLQFLAFLSVMQLNSTRLYLYIYYTFLQQLLPIIMANGFCNIFWMCTKLLNFCVLIHSRKAWTFLTGFPTEANITKINKTQCVHN